jgi:hypothetical protein
MAEKIQINLSNDEKKSSNEQFLQAPRNWEKCSAFRDFINFPNIRSSDHLLLPQIGQYRAQEPKGRP